MSRRLAPLVSLFVAPPAATPRLGLPGGGPEAPARPQRPARPDAGGDRSRRPKRENSRRRAIRPAAALPAVVGDAGSAAFAVDLACAAAAGRGLRCGLTAVWGAPLPAPPRGHAGRAAEQLAARLAQAGFGAAAAGGRGVVLALPEDPALAVVAFEQVAAAADGAVAVVPALCGPRAAAFDALLTERDLLVLALAAGAPPALAGPAAARLADLAPGARLVTVTLEQGGALPRPLRHRAAIRQVLGAGR